jgi:hypothetical protein
MSQLHKRFSDEQILSLLHSYEQGLLTLHEALKLLGISRSRFFDVLKAYRAGPSTFSIAYQRQAKGRRAPETEAAIE